MLMIPCVASVSDRINARKLERFLHSIYLWWKAEQMLATRVPRMLNPFAPEPPVTARADPDPFYPL